MKPFCRSFVLLTLVLGLTCAAGAQGTPADYARARRLTEHLRGLALNIAGPMHWIGDSHHLWYHKTVQGGREFMWVDADSGTQRPAFDHAKLAAALSEASGESFTAVTLPFIDPPAPGGRGGVGAGGLEFTDGETSITFAYSGFAYRCSIAEYTCSKGTALPAGTGGRGRGGPPADDADGDDLGLAPPAMLDDNSVDGIETLSESEDAFQARPPAEQPAPRILPTEKASPDGEWIASIQNFNVFLKRKGDKAATALSTDGSEGNYYTLRSVVWSPNSQYLVAYATRPGYDRHIQYVESSPTTQIQPIAFTGVLYRKPGDTVDIAHPALFNIATRAETAIDDHLFPNPYNLSLPVWWKDSRGFTFDYNQRGHQVYRVIEVDAHTGAVRTLIEEDSKTFVDYRPLVANPTDTGKEYRYDVNDGKEIIWASERDGWEHLYLYNGVTGAVENKITSGDWPVRAVDYVDADKRQIWFEASGAITGQDPYFLHYYRINFDGSGLTQFTSADGTHSVSFSNDRAFYTDTWSTIDTPPIVELRRTSDRSTVKRLETGDAAPLVAAGWQAPIILHTPGRDGKTEIWGVIYRPSNFDAAKKYPVIESIYAGPQGNFVPKAFSGNGNALAELGFIVVQIDGMGTNNRSRAFHDVAWQNLKDAGFADRILWHKAAAAQYPWYDVSHGVGIYGTSAGGQNALGGLLFHPEFYTVGVANSGCHDNRMDKIWWNEQYMGWPIGPQYAASSNVDNAYRLQGKLLLVLGELDDNVDPASTLQVVNQLIKHNKRFDLLEVPGGGHGAGGAYYQHLLQDFFVHNLLHVEPPAWNNAGAAQ